MEKYLSKKGILFNDCGYSLLIAIFALVILSVLGLSIFTVSGNTLNTSSHERTDQAVYYIAEAGLAEVKAELEIDIAKTWDFYDTPENNFKSIYNKITSNYSINTYTYEDHFNKTTRATVVVTPGKTKNSYIIESTGIIDGNSNARAVSQSLLIGSKGSIKVEDDNKEIDPDPCTIPSSTAYPCTVPSDPEHPGIDPDPSTDPDHPNYPGTDPDTDTDPKQDQDPIPNPDLKPDPKPNPEPNPFKGDVLVYTKTGDLLKDAGGQSGKGFTHAKYPENLSFPSDDKLNKLFNPTTNNAELAFHSDPASVSLNKNLEVNKSDIFNNRTVTFNTTTEQTIYINGDLNISNSTINVSGKGNINIVIIGNLDIRSSLTINSIDGAIVNLIVKDKFTLESNSINIDANIYAYKSTESLLFNKPSINGTIVTNATNIKIDGNAHTNVRGFCAPNADYSSGGKYNINGKIVVETFSHSGSPAVSKVVDTEYNPCQTPSILNGN